ncbi:dTDP-4-dehydrorhamnose reductase [Verticiella sediminum]|uniref:dTDP-4-dehydrorhamnose reductase n=1 Tax=Verticiella sediminum TaxID=1247510 RepID=A0A556AC53_9BURK|nr:dTDP-4-dehydrorhamnose reductase [Verticiella sediminum]TSH90453.1 dTDP-4-dehydrorhamnose reductase [Verticiella sediminum]
MRILLTGRRGQLGYELGRSLALLGEVHALDSAACDLREEQAIRRVVREYAPAVIVNPAAYTAVDKAETEVDAAQAVNARAPAILAEEAQRLDAMLVHFSTDYVFDGSRAAPYTEADAPNPQGVYGASKLAGEQAVQRACARHLVLRTSWVVGAHGGNFVKTMLRLAGERDALSVVADQYGAPTSAALLADLTALLVREATLRPDTFAYGLYHAAAAGVTNWHEYACYVIERARAAGRPVRVAPDAIRAIGSADYPTPARRPANSRLDTTRLRTTFGLRLPEWREGVDRVLDQIL